MALCPTSCSLPVPAPVPNNCGQASRLGGISRLVFASCDVDFTDITDTDEWCAYILANKTKATNKLIAQKPAPSFINVRTTSCGPERTIGSDQTITFRDYNVDDTTFVEYDFYNTLKNDPSRFQFGWLSCEGLFYGFVPDFTIEVGDIIPETQQELFYFEGTLKFTGLASVKPVTIAGLENLLTGGCPPLP